MNEGLASAARPPALTCQLPLRSQAGATPASRGTRALLQLPCHLPTGTHLSGRGSGGKGACHISHREQEAAAPTQACPQLMFCSYWVPFLVECYAVSSAAPGQLERQVEVTMVGRVLLGWGRWGQALGTPGFRLQPDLLREAQERGHVTSLMGLKAKAVSQTPMGLSTPSQNGFLH